MPGTHMDPTDHKCYTTLPLYVECQYDKNCLLKNGSYGICNGICDCGEGFRANRDMNDCVRSKNLGDLCVASEECSLIGHATCTGNTCLCEDGYSISMNGKFCLRDAENFGDSCEENVQCKKRLTDAICLEHLKTCGCPPTMHVHNITCIESFQLGDVCDRDEECEYTSDMIGKIKCVNYRCGCVDRSFCNSGSDPLSVTIFLFCVVLFVQHSLR
ncbi:cell death abnormality protein 1 isoform X2 [Aethina tumida]|nr:cell death abnormality protein 1 isoform X2 [Aethina tumida]